MCQAPLQRKVNQFADSCMILFNLSPPRGSTIGFSLFYLLVVENQHKIVPKLFKFAFNYYEWD